MFKPKYSVLIDRTVSGEVCVCLGAQLIELLQFISDKLPPHNWYGANITAQANTIWSNQYGTRDLEKIEELSKLYSSRENEETSSWWIEYQGWNLQKIGNLDELIARAKQTLQFSSAVFVALQVDVQTSENEVELDTEDPPFRPIPLNGVILEIRAFDTSFFSLFCENYSLMKTIARHFEVDIVSSE